MAERKERTVDVVLQGEIGGITYAISGPVNCDNFDAELDFRRRALERQRAHNSLVEALVDLKAREESVRDYPERERAMLKGRAEERARKIASFDAAASISPRRVQGRSKSDQQWLDEFDAQTKAEQAKMAAEKERIEKEIPMYDAQVSRQRAIIAGRDRSDVIGFSPLPDVAAAE